MMHRRGTVTLHDLVTMDETAKKHYQRLQDNPTSRDEALAPRSATWLSEDGHHEIEYDPLLLAESLVLLEEHEEKEDTVSPMSPMPVASHVPTVTRRVSVSGKPPKAIVIPDVERKKSAIDEHERVMEAMRKLGLCV